MIKIKNQIIEENVATAPLSGISIGGKVKFFTVLEDETILPDLIDFATQHNVRSIMIGEGTNTFFGRDTLQALLIQNKTKGKKIISDEGGKVVVEIMGGETWDEVVEWAVKNELGGIEALSAIPGTVGAAPVQNIGAYGSEFAEVCMGVEVYDSFEKKWVQLTKHDCEFSYRDSIFKRNPGRYYITKIIIALERSKVREPNYAALKNYLAEKDIENPTLQQIRDAITDIRWSKLPKPEEIPNCGSWFKNPIVLNVEGARLKEKFPDLKLWKANENNVKISAAWLVEQSVGREFALGGFKNYQHHALVLINPQSNSNTKKFLEFENHLKQKVEEKFGINLEREPILIE